ncbi:hypothetical protein Tco_0981533 [Tanacetum coccineum]
MRNWKIFDSIKKTRVRTKEWSDSLIDQLNLKSTENEDLKAQIQDKVFVITSLKNDLRKLKGKEIVENVVHIPSANTIAPGMFKIDLEPLPPRLLQNREVHIDYLRNTQEQANIIREIVEQAKAKQPLDGELDLACKYTIRIQELLVYVQDTCPNAITLNTRKVAVTPMNNIKKVRSKPPGNKKNDRISQTPSRNKKNKVEAQPRKVNNSNRVVKPVCDIDVKHSLSNTNSEILYATCNKSMFDGVHDKCLIDLVQNENNHTKSAKKHIKQNVWKPTGHVFTEVGFKWKPTGRTFTIVGNSYPLTRMSILYSGTVRFENDQIARIMRYGDYQLGNIIISRGPETQISLDAKADIGIFVGYAPANKAFKIYNRRTRIITKTIHVTFDELTTMASEQFSSGPGLHYMTPVTSSTRLDSNPVS